MGRKLRLWHGSDRGSRPRRAGSFAGSPKRTRDSGRRTGGASQPPTPPPSPAARRNGTMWNQDCWPRPSPSGIHGASSTSSIACSSRSRFGFTVRRTARGFSAKTRTRAADPTPSRTSAPAIRVPTRTATWTASRTSQRLPRNPRLAWRGGVWHLLRVEVPCVSTSPFRQSD